MPDSMRIEIDEIPVENVDILRGSNMSLLFETIKEGAYCVDRDRRIIHWNKAAEQITGYSAEEVAGTRCSDNILKHVDGKGVELCNNDHCCPLFMTMCDGSKRDANVYLLHKDGRRIPVKVRTMPMRDSSGYIVGALELFDEDGVVERLRSQLLELSKVAYIDSLTSLPNRRYLDIALFQSLEEWERYGWEFACFLSDIDYFKGINDLHGHAIGDKTISTVANTMAMACRSSDMVGRWGGDESMGILKKIDQQSLTNLMNRICALIRTTRILHDRTEISVTVSIGATMVKKGDTVESIMKRTDQALYQSKRDGRNMATIM